ncbi:ImmA/IrrE family metallo-endopeptidase [Ramlibacter sp.]|uniref:ImmA/IrrE family metallo-endopeptidase n=1 Tax=Ramlibacter sp. TaxID=1917967 RepID=UPI00261BA9FC|nr:ImmA/IrrE family metallo-endopeptidase [Ramlibacter sp.]MDB5957503.1 neutral zinc metallopeptidase [Ramlibacter sp.]
MTTLGNGHRSRLPTGMKVAPTSYAKLELAADSLRPLLPRERGSQYKIDGARVLERTLRQAEYEFHVEHAHNLEDCAAFTIPDEGLVVLRQDVYDGLFRDSVFSRSTVIHEVAHIVLKHHVTLRRGAVGQHKFYEDSEWQAKAMTAAVMMPMDACQQARNAYDLAEMCGTSVEAATYRLERLIKERLISRKL